MVSALPPARLALLGALLGLVGAAGLALALAHPTTFTVVAGGVFLLLLAHGGADAGGRVALVLADAQRSVNAAPEK